MKSMSTVSGAILLVLVLMLTSTGQAQSVEFDLNFPSYDVIYLTDLVDIRNVSLSPSIPDVTFEIRPTSPTPFDIILRVRAELQLRGDSQPTELVRATSEPFTLQGVRRFSSRDLSGSTASDIKFRTLPRDQITAETQALRDKLEDYVQRFPTAPVGQYTVEVRAFLASSPTVEIQRGIRKTITVRNASETEVVVTLISPEQGSAVPTPFPTFTWSSEKPEVTLYVYEKLRIHRSPEEAVTGIPYLQQQLSGVSTFTYPADALRRLEVGKSYFWFVETRVRTTRGDLTRRSEIRLFRVQPQVGGNQLARILSTLPGDAAARLAQLIQEGWSPSGASLDGKPVEPGELNELFQRLIRDDIAVNFRIED